MKLTKKQMQKIIDNTPDRLKGYRPGSCALVDELGYYQPCEANWSYHAGWLADGTLVVLQFGSVVFGKI